MQREQGLKGRAEGWGKVKAGATMPRRGKARMRVTDNVMGKRYQKLKTPTVIKIIPK